MPIAFQYHLLNHLPENRVHHIRRDKCPHCKLERRNDYGNLASNQTRQILNQHNNQQDRPRRNNQPLSYSETFLEYDQHGNVSGFEIVEPLSRNRYLIEHYYRSTSRHRNWVLDQLYVISDNQRRSNRNIFEDVLVDTSVKNLNKKTEVKTLQEGHCVICLNNFKMEDVVREIKHCNHQYHLKCFDKWAETNRKCPLCNYDFSLS